VALAKLIDRIKLSWNPTPLGTLATTDESLTQADDSQNECPNLPLALESVVPKDDPSTVNCVAELEG